MYIILLLVLVLLLLWLYVRSYRRNWSRNLTLGVGFSKPVFYEGEKGRIVETVVNKKLMPLWWGDIQFLLPPFIAMDDTEYHGTGDYKNSVSAFSYEMVTKNVPFTALRRGYYKMTGAEMLTLDLFFHYRLLKKYPAGSEIYVYPDLRLIERYGADLKRLTGEVLAKRHYIEDQFQLRGIRDYHPFDSLKNINWSATAKTGEIKVNQYDYTTSQEVYLLLDFDPFSSWDSQNLKEDLIRVAAYLLRELSANGVPVGLITNAADVQDGGELGLPCKNGLSHRESFMKTLARINTDKATRPFADILDRLAAQSGDPEYILLSYAADMNLQEKIGEFRAARKSLQWVLLKGRESRITLNADRRPYICEVV